MRDEKEERMTSVLPEMLTTREVARALRLSPYRIGVLAREGKLPGAVRIGERGDWRFIKDEIERLLAGESP